MSTTLHLAMAWLLLASVNCRLVAGQSATRPPEYVSPPAPVAPSAPSGNRPGAALPAPVATLAPSRLELPQTSQLEAGRALPINLPTALRLSDARPILIAAAQASVRVAAMEFERTRVLWLPNLNAGVSYYRHDGGVQASSGQFFINGRNQFMAGGGPYAVIETADAFFAPLAARQVLRARRFDVQRARNDALLSVAEAYFNVQQARGRLAGAEDAAEKAARLVQTVDALAAGLVSPIESNRVRTLLASLKQSAAAARGEWGVASAELTRALRLDPTVLVMPLEPPQLQITIMPRDRSVDELVTIGLTSRPELASQQALVQAALARLRQERLRPLMPSVLLLGDAVPTSPGGFLMGGVFASSNNGQGAPIVGRNDVSVEMLWGLNNLGLGNRAIVRERRAEQQQTLIELFRIQDTIAAEVAAAYSQLDAAAIRVKEAESGIQQAQISYVGNVKGLSETTRFGDILVLVNRPQEVVAALQQLAGAYDNYFISLNEYNRAQFRLYRAVGYPAGILAYEQSLGPVESVNTRRPAKMAPVGCAGLAPSCR